MTHDPQDPPPREDWGRPGRPVPPPEVPVPGAGEAPPDIPPPDGLPPEKRGPLRREVAWGWQYGLAGLAAGFAPELLLYATSLFVTAPNTTNAQASLGSAVALVVISVITYCWQAAVAWFFSLRIAGRRLAAWGFRLPTKAYFWTIPTALAVVYVVSVFHDWLVHPKQQEVISIFPHSAAGIVLFALYAVVIAPVFEEIFFRGFVFRAFASSWGWIPGAVVSAAIFAIAHAQLDVFVPLFTLGLVLCWVYQRTGSIWTNISLHALFNGISIVLWTLGH